MEFLTHKETIHLMTKFTSANSRRMFHLSCIILEFIVDRANSVNPNEVAQYELSLGLHWI